MARMLAAVLLMTGLALLAPSPAHATLSVSISATPTTLMAGQPTTIKGKAVGAKPGSVVKLQRKVSGVWNTVTQKKVWSTRTYSFTIKPPRGYQYYRVRKPAQLAQAASTSPAVKLTVQWRPTISLTGTNEWDPETGLNRFDVQGRVFGLDGWKYVWLQRQTSSGLWETQPWQTATSPDGSFIDEHFFPNGTVLRYTLPASGPRLAAYSNPVTVSWHRYSVDINSSVRVAGIAFDAPQTVDFNATAGQFLTLVLTDSTDGFEVSVQGPAGPVALDWDRGAARIRVPATGSYQVTFSQDLIFADPAATTLWVSTVKSVNATLDSDVSVVSDLPGQVVAVHFTGVAGEVVTQYSPPGPDQACIDLRLWRPSGQVIPFAWRRNDGSTSTTTTAPVWRLPQDGVYTFVYTPCGAGFLNQTESLMRALKVSAVINTSPGTVTFDRPGRVALVEVAASAGLDLIIAASPNEPAPWAVGERFYAPNGSSLASSQAPFRVDPTVAGTYTVLVTINPWQLGTVSYWASTPLLISSAVDADPVPYDLGPFFWRQIVMDFSGSTGDLFAVVTDKANGQPCSNPGVVDFPGGDAFGSVLWSNDGRDVYRFLGDGAHTFRFIPCMTAGTIRVVSVAPPVPLVLDGPAAQVEVGELGRPGLARFTFANVRAIAVIDSTGLPEGAPFWGAVVVDGQDYSFSGTAGPIKKVLLNLPLGIAEATVTITTATGTEGTFSVSAESSPY